MTDGEARFCWRLADLAHRLDWWNIRDEHTDFEWACQLARWEVEPWGDDRADLRAALNTTRQIVSQAAEPPDLQAIQETIRSLQFYLEVNKTTEPLVTPAEAENRNQ